MCAGWYFTDEIVKDPSKIERIFTSNDKYFLGYIREFRFDFDDNVYEGHKPYTVWIKPIREYAKCFSTGDHGSIGFDTKEERDEFVRHCSIVLREKGYKIKIRTRDQYLITSES